MSEYPFDLQGMLQNWEGNGRKNGGSEISGEFTLAQGVVIAEIEHHGHGDFKLKFVPTEGLSEGETTAAQIGGGAAAGFAAGATLGSIVPVAGTILGGLIGGAAGYLAGDAIGDAIAPTVWNPVDGRGRFNIFALEQVKEGEENALSPGKYRLEVESEASWTCRFIQPDIGQSAGTLVAEKRDLNENSIDAPVYLAGPLKKEGSRPVLADILHNGRGYFSATAYSVDGTHKRLVFEQAGQFYVEDQPTEIIPSKEYFFYFEADGEWNINFTEGY